MKQETTKTTALAVKNGETKKIGGNEPERKKRDTTKYHPIDARSGRQPLFALARRVERDAAMCHLMRGRRLPHLQGAYGGPVQ